MYHKGCQCRTDIMVHSELTMILTAYNVEIQNSCNFGNTNNMFPDFYCVALKLCLYSVLSFIVS